VVSCLRCLCDQVTTCDGQILLWMTPCLYLATLFINFFDKTFIQIFLSTILCLSFLSHENCSGNCTSDFWSSLICVIPYSASNIEYIILSGQLDIFQSPSIFFLFKNLYFQPKYLMESSWELSSTGGPCQSWAVKHLRLLREYNIVIRVCQLIIKHTNSSNLLSIILFVCA